MVDVATVITVIQVPEKKKKKLQVEVELLIEGKNYLRSADGT